MPQVSRRMLQLLVAFVWIIFLWGGSVWLCDPMERLFPGPATTFATWWIERSVWIPHARATGGVLFASLSSAFLLAIPMAYAMQLWPKFRAGIETIFLVLQCLPLFVFTPVLVAVLGWGIYTVILPSILVVLFPLCMSLYKGLKTVPESYLQLFSTFEMSPWAIFWTVQLPYALPALFAGLRMAIAAAGTAVLAAEFAGGQEGLGMLIQESRRNFDLAMTFASILTVGSILGVLVGISALLESVGLKGRKHVAVS